MRTVSFLMIFASIYSLAFGEFRVNTNTSCDQEHTSVASVRNSDFIVVWDSDYQDGNGDGVFAQRFDKFGRRLGSEFQVNVSTSGYQKEPDIASNSNHFVVVWHGPDGSNEGIFIRIYDSNGIAKTGEIQVNTYTNSRQIYPKIAMNENGNIVVVWESNTYVGDNHLAEWNIRGRVYDINGNALTSELAITPHHQSQRPDVAIDSDGDFTVVWWAENYRVGMRRFNANGTAKGDVENITAELGAVPETKIGMNSNSDYVVVWTYHPVDWRQDDIYAKRFLSNGMSIGSEMIINSITDGQQAAPEVVMREDGTFVVVWSGPDGDEDGIFVREFDATGVPEYEEYQINRAIAERQYYVRIAMLNDENFVTVWQSNLQDGSEYGVYASLEPKIFESDFSLDGIVDIDDFVMFAESWLVDEPVFDLIEDNTVNMADFTMFGSEWLSDEN